MSEPFNSQAPHFMTKVKAYCAKVLPLVFDNSLSYYEFLCKMCHKLNETIDALNAQNLNIIEFTHMMQLEIEKFENYVDERITNFENEIQKQWEEYKALINAAFEEFKNQMRAEWEQEKQLNETFRTNLLRDFNSFKAEVTAAQAAFENKIKGDFETYKANVNTEIAQFENRTNASLTTFKSTMQTQQNEFEAHMVELFNNFKTTEKQARTDFESNFQQLFEQWKVDTLAALDSNINQWETGTTEALKEIIDNEMRIYKDAINLQLADITRQMTLETDTREAADEELQRQIDQLTPEGTIKADTPDTDNNSQLYTIDKATGTRTNIFPKVHNSGGDVPDNVVTAETIENNYVQLKQNYNNIIPKTYMNPVFLTPSFYPINGECHITGKGGGNGCAHWNFENYIQVSSSLQGVIDLGDKFLKIPLNKIPLYDPQNADVVLRRLIVEPKVIFKGTVDITKQPLVSLIPVITKPIIDGDNYTFGLKLIIATPNGTIDKQLITDNASDLEIYIYAYTVCD